MSVIPQEDNLVMSFSEATRVFNHSQSNTGSFVPGTGDAGVQERPLGRGNSYMPPPLEGRESIYPYNKDSYGGQGTSSAPLRSGAVGDGHSKPFDVAEGTAAVVPAAMPTQQQVYNNPDMMVEIRNPSQAQQIDFEEEEYSNPWFSSRRFMRVYFAEFLGTMVLVLWGEGTQAQVVAARRVPDDYLSIAWGWGIGFLLAIYLSSGISGGHINPAVTIALAVFRKFSWKKVPGYILAQMLGGFAGAAVIFGVYYGPLHAIPTGYAAVLTTGPAGVLPGVAATFFSVFTGAALLMGAISAFTDTGNNPASPGLTPLLLGLIMVGIASSFGYQTGFVLNPARDLGPRFLVWATGVSGRMLWLDDNAYGIWIPLVGTTAGALFGNFVYDVLIYNGRDSPLNYNFSRRRARGPNRRHRVEAANTSSRLSDGTVMDNSDPLHDNRTSVAEKNV